VDNLRTLFVLNPATDCKQGAQPAPKPTAVTYTGAVTAQYSDPAALSAKLEDISDSPAVPLAGKTLDFVLGTQTTSGGPTAADGNAGATLTVQQEPASVSSVVASFAGDADFAVSSDTKPFQVTKEDCTLTYVGDIEVAEGSTTSLAADLGEPDTSLGNRANKTITFKVVDSSGASQTFNATTDANGHAATSQTLAPGAYSVSASFAGDGFYQACQTAQDTKVTVTPKTPVCTVTGTPGNDVLHGTEGDDVICGFGGNDRLFGHGGNDLLLGGVGNDRLEGSFGTDELHGQNGNDTLNGGPDSDQCNGGAAIDTATQCEGVLLIP
jgi:Ca2+-binding RTX toxin-like protein